MTPSQVSLVVAIAAEVVATICLKQSDGMTRVGPALAVVLGYGVAFYCLSLALRTIPVGVAYALWSGAGIVLVSLAGWLLFGQRIDGAGLAGIGLILAGVVVMNVYSASAAH